MSEYYYNEHGQRHCACSKKEDEKRSNRFESPICRFLRTLTAGDDVDQVIFGGVARNVDAFASFNENTGIAIFTQNNGAVVIAACDQIDALIINNRC
jgi:hypothetical protein